MSTPVSNVRIISPIPIQWESTPFFSFLRMPSKTISEDVDEALTPDERADAERWIKQQEQESKEAFLKEARRKQFAHVYQSEPPPKR